MRKELFMNGVGVMAVIDNKYYLEDYEFGCYKGCTRNEFIEELKNVSWTCLSSWSRDLRKQYLDLVDYVNNMKEAK